MVEKLNGTSYYKPFQKIPDPVKADEQPEIDQDMTIDDAQKKDLSRRYSMAYFG